MNKENLNLKMKRFLLNLFFPKFCFGCQKQGIYLCQDCQALIDFSPNMLFKSGSLSRIYWSADYENFIVKKLIQNFKYKPFAKDLAYTLNYLIIIYLQSLEKPPEFLNQKQEFILIPIPLSKKRLKWRGFNQAELIAKQLSEFLKIPLYSQSLIKTRDTALQFNLPQQARKKNVQNAFSCVKPEIVKNKIVLLIDDVYTTGATMEQSAKALKQAGAKYVWGIVVARG